MTLDSLLPRELEPLPGGSHCSPKTRLAQGLKALTKRMQKAFINPTEPTVRTRITQAGQTVFDAYDPLNQDSVCGVSEADMRTWLEKRYYRQPSGRFL